MRHARCPRCPDRPLAPVQQGGRRAYACAGCEGHAVTVSAVRAHAGQHFTGLWAAVLERATPGGATCPGCHRPMQVVSVPAEPGAPPVEVDLCRPCQLFWFDPGEQEQVAPAAPPPPAEPDLPDEARRLLAMEQVRLDTERERTRRRLERAATLREGGMGHTSLLDAFVSFLVG